MKAAYQISRPDQKTDVPFDHLVLMLKGAFAGQTGIVTPPSSAEKVDVAELSWRFDRDAVFLARDPAGNVIGQVWFEDRGEEGYLYKLAVDPVAKGTGVGRALVAAVIDHARQIGKQSVRLHVRKELTGNIAFFEANGFAVTSDGFHEGFDTPTYRVMHHFPHDEAVLVAG